MLLDWLVVGQTVPGNPASAVRGPKHVVKTGTTPVLDGDDGAKLLDGISAATLRDLRDRALIATLTYSFARINAALKMKVEDLRPRGPGWAIWLHEKGGKHHIMPCHHALAKALHAYINAAGIAPCLPHRSFAAAYALRGETERAAAELAEARKLNGGDLFSSIARLKAYPGAWWGAPETRALYEATYFAGLRKAGMPEE
jgi:integrase